MYDSEAIGTVTSEPKRRGVETIRIRPFRWKPTFRMTRAHLMIARRPALADAGHQFLELCVKALGEQLGAPLNLRGELTPGWLNPFEGLSRFSMFALLDLSAVGTLACLEIDALSLGAMLARVAGSAKRLALPLALTRLEEAAFGWLLLLAVEAIRAQPLLEKLFAPRLLSVHANRTEALERLDCRKRHLAFQARLDLEGTRGVARLIVPSLAIERACHLDEEPKQGPLHPIVSAARVSTRIMCGRSPLSLTDLASLGVGDVVVFEDMKSTHGIITGPARLESRTFELHGELGAAGFTFTHAVTQSNPEEPSMPNPNPVEVALPVEVEVELTRLQLAVGDLATLRPGAVVPLHINSAQPIVLRIGDRVIARAEVVEIDGELGARIIALEK